MAVGYNQKGYIGTRMSVRQAEAYSHGERPISQWTKTEILGLVKRYYPASVYSAVLDWPAQDIKQVFLARSSWHHTGKYAGRTDFYMFNENAEPESISYRDGMIKQRKAAPRTKPTSAEKWAVQSWTEWITTRSGRRKSVDRRSVISWTEKEGKAGMVTVYESPGSKAYGQKRLASFYKIRQIAKPRINSKVWQECY